MLFSIIVPVYNVKPYLSRCVESLRRQTFDSYEIILVDDGSTDGSGIVCDKYSEEDPKIKVIHKPNGGLSDARNAGIKTAQGDYIMFVDSDDWIKDNTLERFEHFIRRSQNVKNDILIGEIVNEDNTRYSPKSKAEIAKAYTGKDYYVKFSDSIIDCSVASIYRRKYILDNSLEFPLGKLHEDYYFTTMAYINASFVMFTGIDFYIRFVREDSITTARDKRRNLEDVLWISRELHAFSLTVSEKQVAVAIQNRIVNSYLSKYYDTNIFQYPDVDYRQYTDKLLTLRCAHDLKCIAKALLFCASPRLYIIINAKSKNLFTRIR